MSYGTINTRVKILNTEKKWTLVKWSNGETSWIPKEMIQAWKRK